MHLYEPCHKTLVSGVRVYRDGCRISGKGAHIPLRPNYFIFIGYTRTGGGGGGGGAGRGVRADPLNPLWIRIRKPDSSARNVKFLIESSLMLYHRSDCANFSCLFIPRSSDKVLACVDQWVLPTFVCVGRGGINLQLQYQKFYGNLSSLVTF